MKRFLSSAAVFVVCIGSMNCTIPSGGRRNWFSSSSPGGVLTSSDQQFQITVLPGWTQVTDLHPTAALQAADKTNHLYAMVIGESKQDFSDPTIERYSDLIIRRLLGKLESPRLSGPVAITINGYKALQYEIRAPHDNVNLVRIITTVETDQHFYQVWAWTLSSRFDTNKGILRQVTNSLKEIGP